MYRIAKFLSDMAYCGKSGDSDNWSRFDLEPEALMHFTIGDLNDEFDGDGTQLVGHAGLRLPVASSINTSSVQ